MPETCFGNATGRQRHNIAMNTKHLLSAAGVAVIAAALAWGQSDGFQRERGGGNDKLKDALEGKAPPKITATEWLNSKPLDLKKLKGKVVVLDFWAHW